jgi:hypothetical protein
MAITTVETVGDPAVMFAVCLDVGVQDQQRDPTHIEPPHPGKDLTTGEGYAHHDASVFGTEMERVHRGVVLRLPAICDLLIEIAMPVEEPDPGQREPPIAGGLQMVPGEDAKSTGVLGHERVDAELGGAIGDLRGHQICQDRVEVGDLQGNPLDQPNVTEEVVELLMTEIGDDRDRMPVRSGPGQ